MKEILIDTFVSCLGFVVDSLASFTYDGSSNSLLKYCDDMWTDLTLGYSKFSSVINLHFSFGQWNTSLMRNVQNAYEKTFIYDHELMLDYL